MSLLRAATTSPVSGPAPVTSSQALLAGDRPGRVHVVTGSFGAGHDAAAREIALRLRAEGHLVEVHDIVDLFPCGLGPVVRASYLWQIRRTPGSWRLLLRVLERDHCSYRVVRLALRSSSRRLLAATRGADLVVATHPFASQVLGELRRRGRLRAPAATYLTDASVHPLWVHPEVDLHLALHDVAAAQAERWGARVQVIAPLVPQGTHGPVTGARRAVVAAEVRRELGLRDDLPVALVVGGSLGIGELQESAHDLAVTGRVHPVVMCGSDESLRRRLALDPSLTALGWRDDLPRLLCAASVTVQNSGGFMSRESLSAGVPVLSYRCLPGHGETNAAALEAAGMVPWARTTSSLDPLLADVLAGRSGPVVEVAGALPAPSLVEALSGGGQQAGDSRSPASVPA